MTDIPEDVMKLAREAASGYFTRGSDNDERLKTVIARAILADRAAQAERMARLEAGLAYIRLKDWGWKGGGSNVRIAGEYGRIASRLLGLPVELPLGWPSADEYASIAAARALSQEGSDA